ncbi:hypothetical protein ACFL0A_00785 [Patescibacteria group bacterium]
MELKRDLIISVIPCGKKVSLISKICIGNKTKVYPEEDTIPKEVSSLGIDIIR